MNDELLKYPALYKSADKASNEAQKIYISLNKFNLVSLVLATLLSVIDVDNSFFPTASIILLFISLVLTVLLYYIKLEKKWYEGRAIAESIKTLTWKFMMGAEPFHQKYDLEEAENKLIKNFKKVIGQNKDFFELIGGDFATDEQITPQMRGIREIDLEGKKSIYLKKRVDEQRQWYANRSNENKTNKKISFFVIITLIILSGIGVFINLKNPDLKLTLTPITIAIASSLVAWMQLKRYQELTQSYSIAANELGMIKSKAHHITSEDELSSFVDDAETAISREHTLWLARRDNVELFD